MGARSLTPFYILQSHFLLSGQHSDSLWIVPITLSLGSYNKHKSFLLETKFHEVDISEDFAGANTIPTSETIPNTGDGNLWWIKVNISQSGFYRVKYEDKLAFQLRKAIENNLLSDTDKFGQLKRTMLHLEVPHFLFIKRSIID